MSDLRANYITEFRFLLNSSLSKIIFVNTCSTSHSVNAVWEGSRISSIVIDYFISNLLHAATRTISVLVILFYTNYLLRSLSHKQSEIVNKSLNNLFYFSGGNKISYICLIRVRIDQTASWFSWGYSRPKTCLLVFPPYYKAAVLT